MRDFASEINESEISILLVEDDPVAREILSIMIPRKFPGMKIYAAKDGMTGLELFKGHRPEIVITDINMPGMDGLRMADEIKSLDPDAIIIAITAYSDTHYLLNAIECGINHYVLKPVDHKKLFAIIEKCTAGIRLERQVRRQHDHIRKLSRAVEQSPASIIITDAGGAIEYVNPKFTEITGYASEEVLGRNPRIFKSGVTPPDTYKNLWETVTAGREWRGEFLNRKKGGELYWESASISPIPDDNGIIIHFVAVKEDITARKRAEEEIEILNTNLAARAAELEAANRELEAFSHTVSHDLRSPLTKVSGFSQILLELCADRLDEESRSYLRKIYEGTRLMNQLIDTILNFSRTTRSEMSREKVDLSEMAQEIGLDLRLKKPERRVTFTIAEGVKGYGDKQLLRVVMENLLGNAWKYTGKKEAAVIEFGVAESEGNPAYFVRDNGAGFDMSQADKLFGAFQRLHSAEEFEGHGIGLATVQRVIQRHGGRVWAEGEAGKGATFYFTLPLQS
ncbi:MAG: response receiver sensor histidine [Geobacteraceae bacterium]|nr:MAG: response receiver sensor histidine [Geobacteraceae bacterium]